MVGGTKKRYHARRNLHITRLMPPNNLSPSVKVAELSFNRDPDVVIETELDLVNAYSNLNALSAI